MWKLFLVLSNTRPITTALYAAHGLTISHPLGHGALNSTAQNEEMFKTFSASHSQIEQTRDNVHIWVICYTRSGFLCLCAMHSKQSYPSQPWPQMRRTRYTNKCRPYCDVVCFECQPMRPQVPAATKLSQLWMGHIHSFVHILPKDYW